MLLLCFIGVLRWFASFVCFLASCVGLHRLLLGSEVKVLFVWVFCDEPSGNKQMAHSQIAVVIAFSLTFEMDVRLVFHRRPLGNVGFHRQLPFTMICSGMLTFFVVKLFVYVCLGFHECGGFCFRLFICCCCLFPFSSVCYRLLVFVRSCTGLHCLLSGSESQSYLLEFHAKGQVVTNRWRIHRLWF